uniref:Ig-like domain-containing protein n=1 Tax=Pyxicephalus adspersus TaxID=30357 RepID=A0AAV3AAV5_PYXAD|nr:TPA: hypothetical protein GDO54_017237 [Pyxicephalus adspersus]
MNGTQKVRLLERDFYNQEEFVYFDSDVGYFIPKTELGRPSAEYWNKDKDIIEQRKAAVQTFCIHNYGILHSVTADRRVQPTVQIYLMPEYEDPPTNHHMLMCSAYGFYPSEIEVKWFRNGQEEISQVESTEPYQNGDWTFQIMVMLETEIQKGDLFTCEVQHKSLEAPIRIDWKPHRSDSATSKVATGIVGLLLGLVFIIAGPKCYSVDHRRNVSFV